MVGIDFISCFPVEAQRVKSSETEVSILLTYLIKKIYFIQEMPIPDTLLLRIQMDIYRVCTH